jgi:PIN like domain
LEPRFSHRATDYEWMAQAGAEGWLCITRDKKIRSRPGERRALIDNRVGCFYLIRSP